jgi:hypothetical protein
MVSIVVAQDLNESVREKVSGGTEYVSRKARRMVLLGLTGVFVFAVGAQIPNAVAYYMIEK